MKKLFISGFLLFITLNLFSQDLKNSTYGISFGIGKSDIYQQPLDGGPGYDGLTSYELGLNYNRPITKLFSFESGLYWHYNQIKITPNYNPGLDMTSKYYNCNLLYVPLNARLMFLKCFFINGGLLLNLDISKDSHISNQTGVGTDLGVGVEIPALNLFKICINPYVNIHGLYRFEKENYPQSLFDSGIKIIIKR